MSVEKTPHFWEHKTLAHASSYTYVKTSHHIWMKRQCVWEKMSTSARGQNCRSAHQHSAAFRNVLFQTKGHKWRRRSSGVYGYYSVQHGAVMPDSTDAALIILRVLEIYYGSKAFSFYHQLRVCSRHVCLKQLYNGSLLKSGFRL